MSQDTQSQKKRKPEGLPFHPLANLFDPLEGKELDELVGDIKRRGLRFPIVTYQGVIIDGRNRALACARAGVEPRYEEFSGSEEDVPRFIISANIHRRHLKPEKRRELIKTFLQANPTKSDRAHAADLKVDKNVVSRARKELESNWCWSTS
jgi:ParB-like chromosome segregation protein Spo0J